jgi:probable RNA-binding protein EIF1AD
MPKPKRNINAVAEETLTPPHELPQHQAIARLKQAAGNNLYNVELPGGKTMLAELNQKFRSTIWLKRGSYVVVDTASLANRDNKLGGEIVNVVGDQRQWRKMPYWPAEFAKKSAYEEDSEDEDEGPKMPPSDDEEDD